MATKAWIVVKGINSGPIVKFDCGASDTSIRTNEEMPFQWAWTPTQMSNALKTTASSLCNESDSSLNLSPSDFNIQ